MGHMLLPKHPQKGHPCSERKHVDTGIRLMVKGIGVRNAKSAQETLSKLGIPLLADQVGGNRERTVEFDLATGNMVLYFARDGEQRSF